MNYFKSTRTTKTLSDQTISDTDTNDFIMKYFGYEFEVMLYLLDLLLIWMYSTMILMTHFLYLITHFIS